MLSAGPPPEASTSSALTCKPSKPRPLVRDSLGWASSLPTGPTASLELLQGRFQALSRVVDPRVGFVAEAEDLHRGRLSFEDM